MSKVLVECRYAILIVNYGDGMGGFMEFGPVGLKIKRGAVPAAKIINTIRSSLAY